MESAGGDSSGCAKRSRTRATRVRKGLTEMAKQGVTEHFKTRFSAKRLQNVLRGLSPQRKKWISDNGFNALLSIADFSVPMKLVKWMINYIDPLLCEFRFHDKVIVFNKSLVCKILGLPTGNTPVKMSGKAEDVAKLHDAYREGERAKIMKCVAVLKDTKDQESFMRAFMILALGTVFCPGTANTVSLKYLHSLVDMSQLQDYDWATHIQETLMVEICKYQKFPKEALERDHQIGACLPILAIAYMDHLDIPMDRASHKINYDLPRICNISNADFDFVMNIDKCRLSLSGYGRLPFRDFSRTTYFDVPATDDVQNADSTSLDGWLHPSGSSSQGSQQLPPCYQQIATQFNNLWEKDVDAFADAAPVSIRDGIKALWRNRSTQMMAAMLALCPQNQGSSDISLRPVAPPNPVPNESDQGKDPDTTTLSECELACNMDKVDVISKTDDNIPASSPKGDGKVEISSPICDGKASGASPKSDLKRASSSPAEFVADDRVLVTAECFSNVAKKNRSQ